jgi:hypothetical protein
VVGAGADRRAARQAGTGPVLQRSHDEWRAPLARWLTATKDTVSGLTQSEIDTLVADPPLPLFVLIEAATHPDARGLRLGPLGSIIVADTILGRAR